MGTVAALQSLGRQTSLLRPHASRSEADYFEGAAAKVRLSEAFSLTGFASHRAMDATLNKADGTAATLTTNGYHRTTAEMEKKRNTHQTATGLLLNFRYEGFHAGLTAVYTHLDRSLQPNRQILYRRHYPHGKDFLNTGVCYGYTHHRVAIGGETAADGHGHVATINSVSVLPTDRCSYWRCNASTATITPPFTATASARAVVCRTRAASISGLHGLRCLISA